MTRFLLASSLLLAACGGSVAPDAVVTDSGTVAETASIEPSPEWAETASCAAIEASCGGVPAVVVKGHAEGLTGLDGARVEFAVRYIREEGMGLDVPRGVALGRTHVAGGAFSTCVCVPDNANMYPEIAAVVYRTATTSLTSADVARATFSQRYATGPEEDLGYALKAVPSDLQKEAAVAATVERTAHVMLDVKTEGRVYAGLIANERPFAAQVNSSAAVSGKVDLEWMMPGRAWSSERVAFFIDKNDDGKCDGSDTGGFAPYATSTAFDGKWLTGTDLAVVCDALQPGVSRE